MNTYEALNLRMNETRKCKISFVEKYCEYSYIFAITKKDNKIIISHGDTEITTTLTNEKFGNRIQFSGYISFADFRINITLVIERDLKNDIEKIDVMTVEGVTAIEFE